MHKAVRHTIFVRGAGVAKSCGLSARALKKSIAAALESESVDIPCEVSVLITDDARMGEINLQFRGIAATTDVLSFPMQEYGHPGWSGRISEKTERETEPVPLGDIVISAPRAVAQALEYGHGPDREAAYLAIHSVLHLLGYDHVDEAEGKKLMRSREKAIIKKIAGEK